MKRFFVAVCLILLPLLVKAQDVRTYIPENAFSLLPLFKQEIGRLLPSFDFPHYFLALAEHESCVTLKSKKCLSSKSQLKTKREEGAGLAQLTRAYNEDGSLRFDIIAELRTKFSKELKLLEWATVYDMPELQIRAMVLLSRENHNYFADVKDPWGRLGFTDSAYNGGRRDAAKARKICGMSVDCDPNLWFNHSERFNPKSTKPLYGTRSAKDINNHHVRDVLLTRMPKYEKFYKN